MGPRGYRLHRGGGRIGDVTGETSLEDLPEADVTRTAGNLVVAVLVCLVAAALAAPAGAARGDVRAGKSHAGRRAAGGGGGGLSFTEPVALESFAPARTAASTVYSARNGEEPSATNGPASQ
jgi:hypothetical protein